MSFQPVVWILTHAMPQAGWFMEWIKNLQYHSSREDFMICKAAPLTFGDLLWE